MSKLLVFALAVLGCAHLSHASKSEWTELPTNRSDVQSGAEFDFRSLDFSARCTQHTLYRVTRKGAAVAIVRAYNNQINDAYIQAPKEVKSAYQGSKFYHLTVVFVPTQCLKPAKENQVCFPQTEASGHEVDILVVFNGTDIIKRFSFDPVQ
uniref:Cystatin domain-containing protein n=1 Tax=Panagrellus redivivus TaxID=6233 RepID=A0A7E4V845_PANRE